MKKTILIISNESNLSSAIKNKLLEQDYEVIITSESGEPLRKIIKEVFPDLVIISLLVSCFEAIELCLRIRRWCHVPLILVNNWVAGMDAPEKSGSCLLVKTNTIDDIMMRVESTFSRN